jgi:acyl-CoA thioesterase-1
MVNPETPASLSIVCFGDSITKGFGVRRPWRQVMQTLLRERHPEISFKVFNAGIDGDTLYGGRRRLRRDVLRHEPDIATIAFGLNDLYMGVPLSEFARNLAEVIDELENIRCRPVLLTTVRPAAPAQLLGGASPESYNNLIRETAARRQVPLLDVWLAWPELTDPWDYFLGDGVHPGEAGHDFMGRLTADCMASLIEADPDSDGKGRNLLG